MDQYASGPLPNLTDAQRDMSVRDKSKRAQAEADAMFLSIGEGALVTDANGNVSRINQAGLKILRMTEEDIIGKWYPDIVVAEDEKGNVLKYIDRPIAEMFMTGKTVFSKVYFRRFDGTRVPVALTVSPVLVNNRPIGAIEIFRDISIEVRLDRAKDEFISLASHQLRTPATGVKQYLTMVLEGYVGPITDAQRRFIQTANESNDRQLRIIDDILKVAAADAGDFVLSKQKVDLVQLSEAVIAEQATKFARKKQVISFHSSAPKVIAEVDKSAFRMVLENLIDNAHKYTYAGKSIDVSITEKEKRAIIQIKDQGTGIAARDINKLFQKFSRLKNPLSVSSGGTGLGLYWVKQILDLHNADVRVESKPSQGTTFIIDLPTQI
jgi:two-component system, OmpR family, phosphate regulon sensor histidine kinase PhoR